MRRERTSALITISSFLLFLAFLSCDSMFPSQSKPEVPEDHTRNLSGALHQPGADDPMRSCSQCHGDSLQGGVQWAGKQRIVAPSCYQCHGALWENEGSGGDDGDDDDDRERDDD